VARSCGRPRHRGQHAAGGGHGSGASGSNPYGLVAHGGQLYFNATDSNFWTRFFRTDGTAAGTVVVESANPNELYSIYSPFSAGPYLYFTGSSSAGSELWRTDGTTAGTVMVRNINGMASDSFYLYSNTNFVTHNALAFFGVYDSATGYGLWKSDGTTAAPSR
jgi:ELWxxDGT repeat protein